MKLLRKLLRTLVTVAALVGLSACATDDPSRSAKTGAVIGAVVGGVLGHQISDASGAPIVGAVVGAIAGGSVGGYMDRQRRDMEQQLSEETARNALNITTLADGSLRVGIASDVSFDLDSAQLRPDAMDTFARIAAVLISYDKTVIHVVGHTDTTGSDAHNQSLSERRAATVGTYLAQQGVPGARLRQEGRGEHELIVRTADGVKEPRNRRVDIVIKPVVQGNEAAAWQPPPYLGS